MSQKQYNVHKIPLTPREKRTKGIRIGIPSVLIAFLLGYLVLSGVIPKFIAQLASRSQNNSDEQAALVAETAVKLFTSIPLDGEYSLWLESVCVVSTTQHCALVREVLGPRIWQEVQDSQSGMINLSVNALQRVYPGSTPDPETQFWRMSYLLLTATGESTHEAVVSVVRDGKSWSFNGFSFLPEDPASSFTTYPLE